MISVNDTLKVKFYGLIGSNGCYKFKEFESEVISNEIHLTAWGTKPNFDTSCPAVMIYLNGEEFNTVLNTASQYKIIIHLLGNSILQDSLFVE